MPTDRRRAEARRRAWGRGPMILRFEPLEDRKLLSTALPDLVNSAFDTVHNLDWGDSFHAVGIVANQGTAPTASAFRVNIYASPTPALGSNSVLLGQVTVPAGLQPGQQSSYDQLVTLPADATDADGTVYIGTYVDPDGAITESSKLNNAATGQGYDTSLVTITARQPSALTGAGLSVYPDQAQWGQTVQVTAQIYNNAAGDAPATRARFVLTPSGSTPGGTSDVTIGSIDVPAVAAWQSVTVVGNITLPSVPPATLLGSSQFTLSIMQDADFVTDQMSPHLPSQGVGYDMVNMAIALPSNTATGVYSLRPNMAVTGVQAPTVPVAFGQTVQVTTTVQNAGTLESGPYKVRYLLVGSSGTLDNALFLGDVNVQSLAAGASQNIVQTVQLPSKLPNGVTLNSGAQARIAVVVDPERVMDDADPTNNAGASDVVTLQLVTADGTVTTTAAQTSATANTTATRTANTTTATNRSTGTTPAAVATPRAGLRARARAAALAAKSKFGPKAQRVTAAHNLKVYNAATARARKATG